LKAYELQKLEALPFGQVQSLKLRTFYRIKGSNDTRGYGCLDHFLENDTYVHSWEMLCRIISEEECQGILLDIGM